MRNDMLWPCRPCPLLGESLSSWFARLALANGLGAAELIPAALPGATARSRDLDRLACDTLLENLARFTGASFSTLSNMHFGRWRGRLFERDEGRGVMPWFLPLYRELSRRPYGQQFCPECLAEDREPHMRLEWRLSFVAVCARHRRILSDACPKCGEPISAMAQPSGGNMSRCAGCGGVLAFLEPCRQEAWTDELKAQARLLSILESDGGILGRYGQIPAETIFRIALRLMQLLAARDTALALRTQVLAALGWKISPASIPQLRQLHLINPRGRAILAEMTGWLLEDWPDRFVWACNGAGVTARHILKSRQSLGPEFLDPVRQYLTKTGDEQADDAPPEARKVSPRSGDTTPWGEHRFWKLDGVSPEVRAAARAHAHAERENVGPWVEKILRQVLRGEINQTTRYGMSGT